MFYVDSQRTVTRRDSSLIVSKKHQGPDVDFDNWSATQAQSTQPLNSESSASLAPRPRGSVQKELITMMFESMLDSIVDSWEVIPLKGDDSTPTIDFGKTGSDLTFNSKKKKSNAKSSRSRQGRSRLDMDPNQADSSQTCWWSAPDEKAIIRFKNGNLYEGNISMKCMHGDGRYQWADGTVYLGNFNDNEMRGKGFIHWKDDTWYEGDFAGNLRHGKGLYVDSRTQRSYAGEWHCGTKHGEGVIYYSKTFKNSYDGHWIYNERFGYGSREYCDWSGYKGEWERNVRNGKGLMIWPNHDLYRGDWKNGVMSGYGIYIWDACYNNTMALPSINAFRGAWEKGQRHGYGVLNLGLGLGSHYRGEFKNNKKHGVGTFVTNNGLILQDKALFHDDNLGPQIAGCDVRSLDLKRFSNLEPYNFQICDRTVGLIYHIDQALKNIDKQAEIRTNIINEYIDNNRNVEWDMSLVLRKDENVEEVGSEQFDGMIKFEESSLRKALRCYETDLLNIYYKYATICNTNEIGFSPVLIRLFLWQLYYDCNVHERGLTLVDIDNIFHQNKEWLAVNPHNPFEKIYLWQFLHSLISVASRLYAKRELPGTKPDTILASAFRRFMDCDVIPGSSRQRGRLVNGFGQYIPLTATYELYRALGEPHTVRRFLRAVRRSPHFVGRPAPNLVEPLDGTAPVGRNLYIFGDELTFAVDDNELPEILEEKEHQDLKLFNFGNLSSKTIIRIFSQIFPQLSESDKIMNLNIELTFFEFFEGFVACAEESIRVKDEELKWREKFLASNETSVPHSAPATPGHVPKEKTKEHKEAKEAK
ncbi:radial spoke head 10 homolog B-like isoform X2 [Trichoplusia ni]|uniref:Radial spoke head 10 homolog B-like isoform X2 n=1 Tax=Trichoplusia ni TaxID=7111 RepID=A0A7E5VG52_TRINI|nr:radial spoke head 10 homolog B-like isoform X2 [Trichoplusia ni]